MADITTQSILLLLIATIVIKAAIANPTNAVANAAASAQSGSEEDEDEKTFNRLNEMISRVQKNLIAKTQEITANANKNKVPLNKQEVAQVAQLRKRYESLENFRRLLIQQKRRQQHSKKQYQECIRSLGKAICDQNTTFYLWAQMLAKDILTRPMEANLEVAEE